MTYESLGATRDRPTKDKPAGCDARDRDESGRPLFRYCPALDHPMAPSYCAERRHAECVTCDTEDTLAPSIPADESPEPQRDIEITARSTEHDWSRMPLRMRLRIALAVAAGVPFRVPGAMRIVAENVQRFGTSHPAAETLVGDERPAPRHAKSASSEPVTVSAPSSREGGDEG